MSREMLHGLIDKIDEKELDTIYKILLKFVVEDKATEDEVEAINVATKEIESGDLLLHEDVWTIV